MAFDAHKNFAYSTVLTAPSPASSGTSLVVQSGDGAKFPAASFNATVWPAGAQPLTSNAEIVRVTNISTDTFTITRTQEGSSARSIVVGDQIANTITPKVLTDIESGGLLANSALLSTIFSDQVQTQANAGSGSGNLYWLNLGGVKLMWGVSSSQNVNTNKSFAFTLPAFFTTVTACFPGSLSASNVNYGFIVSYSTSSVTVQIQTTTSISCTASFFMIGT